MGDIAESPLTTIESQSLADCETAIETNLASFVAVGNALLAIRDGRLYRTPDDPKRTFADYCRERWDMNTGDASRHIGEAEVVTYLQTLEISNVPANEAQAHPLLTFRKDDGGKGAKRIIDLEEVAKVWTKVIDQAPQVNGAPHITARHVKKTVDRILGHDSEEEKDGSSSVVELSNLLRAITDLRKLIKDHAASPQGAFVPLRDIMRYFREIKKLLEESQPNHKCPYCSGRGCMICHELGSVPVSMSVKKRTGQ